MPREYIFFYINGRRIELDGPVVFRRLSEFLRDDQHLLGTKVVCAEGACGSCSVLKGQLEGGEIRYRAVNSCLQTLWQLDGAHIITVEGLSRGDALSAVQDAMIASHGAQCGYCTPGFAVALTAAQEQGIAAEDLGDALSDNLCRCTGYLPLLEAGQALSNMAYRPLAQLYPPGPMLADFSAHRNEEVEIRAGGRAVFAPASVEGAVQVKGVCPQAVIVAGGTELAVPPSDALNEAPTLLSVGRIPELSEVRRDGETLVFGAAATWTQVEAFARSACPELAAYIRRFAAPQIRNVGTVAGSIVHHSSIADSLPPLLALEGWLEVAEAAGRHRVDIQGFSPHSLGAGLVCRVFLPLPRPDQTLRLFKVSSRRGFDRSIVSAAFLLETEAGVIRSLRIALGGIGPQALRLPSTEAYLRGRPLTEATLRGAARAVVREEIAPMSDGRASAEYRGLLVENMLQKFFHSLEGYA